MLSANIQAFGPRPYLLSGRAAGQGALPWLLKELTANSRTPREGEFGQQPNQVSILGAFFVRIHIPLKNKILHSVYKAMPDLSPERPPPPPPPPPSFIRL